MSLLYRTSLLLLALLTGVAAWSHVLRVGVLVQGFQQLKVLRTGRQVSCFVEYDSTESASQCHATQQVRSVNCAHVVVQTVVTAVDGMLVVWLAATGCEVAQQHIRSQQSFQ